jgi:hypothetical protein
MNKSRSGLNRPVFTSGLRKSGTSMARRLLDGHSALYMHSINELHFFHFTNFIDRIRPSQRRAGKQTPAPRFPEPKMASK